MRNVTVDSELGPDTFQAALATARALGALESTIALCNQSRAISVGVQRMIRWPEDRTPAQLARAKHRAKVAAEKPLREKAYGEAVALIGVMEVGGNNRGEKVMEIIRANGGTGPEPWCGDFMAYCYRRAGSKSVSRAWAAVRLYLPHTGLKRTSSPQQGDIVRFTFDHVGMFVRDLGNGTIETIEGNTGRSGAVSDSRTGGDGVYRKIRTKGVVQDYIHVSA